MTPALSAEMKPKSDASITRVSSRSRLFSCDSDRRLRRSDRTMTRTPASSTRTNKTVMPSTVSRKRFNPAKATPSGMEATTVQPVPATAV